MNSTLFFEELWKQYTTKTPSAQKIKSLFEAKGDTVFNDHIAIRTFDDPRVDIDILAKPFITMGYKPKGDYHFEKKKLFAKHFEHENDANAPKIFISQLLLKKFSSELQHTIEKTINQADQKVFLDESLILKGSVWGKPSYQTYKKLLEESEYAAWMYVNGFCSNHFTVDVNKLSSFKSLSEVNTFLKEKGFEMNTAGGEIKGSESQLLEQSSILADIVEIEFEEGVKEVTSCYYEFAFRHPKADGSLFNGFVTSSADKIFESTDVGLRGR